MEPAMDSTIMDDQHDNDRLLQRKPVASRQASTENGENLREPATVPLLPELDFSSTRWAGETREASRQSRWSMSDEETEYHRESASISIPPKKHEDEKQTVTEENGSPPAKSWQTSANRIIQGWWQEIFYIILSLLSLVVLIMVLAVFNQQPLPDWPSGITLNTVVAFLSTIARTGFIVPVVEGLSQSKWNWFKKKSRPLHDFDVFDRASRGPGGSFGLLLRTKGRYVNHTYSSSAVGAPCLSLRVWLMKYRLIGILSALLLISGIATSTLTQSAVAYPSREVPIKTEGSAVTWRIPSADSFSASLNLEEYLSTKDSEAPYILPGLSSDVALVRGMVEGIYTQVTKALQLKEPQCNASKCTWPRFSTLAMCYNVTNITHLINVDNASSGPVNLSLPNGLHMTSSRKDGRKLEILSGTTLSYENTAMYDASILDLFVLHFANFTEDEEDMPPSFYDHGLQVPEELHRGPRAIEFLIHLCVDTYDVAVNDNVLSMNRVNSHTEFYREKLPFSDDPEEITEVLHFITPFDEGTQYTTFLDFWQQEERRSILHAFLTTDGREERYFSPSKALQLADIELWVRERKKAFQESRNITAEGRDGIWWSAANTVARNIAMSMTNSLFNDASRWPWMNLWNGTAWRSEVYVQVRWPWLSLLAAQVVLSALLLILVIFETAAVDIEIIKSSTLAALFAISADEKARLERLDAEGEHLISKEDDRRLLPRGVRGELRKKDGKWVLGGAEDQ